MAKNHFQRQCGAFRSEGLALSRWYHGDLPPTPAVRAHRRDSDPSRGLGRGARPKPRCPVATAGHVARASVRRGQGPSHTQAGWLSNGIFSVFVIFISQAQTQEETREMTFPYIRGRALRKRSRVLGEGPSQTLPSSRRVAVPCGVLRCAPPATPASLPGAQAVRAACTGTSDPGCVLQWVCVVLTEVSLVGGVGYVLAASAGAPGSGVLGAGTLPPAPPGVSLSSLACPGLGRLHLHSVWRGVWRVGQVVWMASRPRAHLLIFTEAFRSLFRFGNLWRRRARRSDSALAVTSPHPCLASSPAAS